MKDFTYINTGRVINLQALVMSEDIHDKSIIQVFDHEGKFLTKGNWFQDNVLAYADRFGIASKAGTGLTVSFRLS